MGGFGWWWVGGYYNYLEQLNTNFLTSIKIFVQKCKSLQILFIFLILKKQFQNYFYSKIAYPSNQNKKY